jgi:hypothetical protein
MDYPFFHANSRGGLRERDSQERNNQATYYSNNPSTCSNISTQNTASEFIGLLPSASSGTQPIGGCKVDTQTSLLWGDPGTVKLKGPKQLFERPFATTPFLGLGDPDAVKDENKVKYGYSNANRKSIQTVMDKQWPVFSPLIPEKEADISENNYFVEPFLRGGFSSRLVPKTRIDLTK